VERESLALDRSFISLGTSNVGPCKGCWNCTREKSCPLGDDDLKEIKAAMLDCDMLIMASPVYTNQVSAQMKALFDRLFTWCHIFPLLGKYSLSACTTGNDGYKETGDFLEKMLATYGTVSFGTIVGTGAYTPGFFPRRESERAKYTKLAKCVAETVLAGKRPALNSWNRRMFTVMKRKMTGVHAVNFMSHGPTEGQPDPPRLMVKLIESVMRKKGISMEQMDKLAALMSFELGWWQSRGWLGVKSFRQLAAIPVPAGFDARARLL
ncbi:MAG: flavodoxin family protein, partial [Spirochaetaceae bacterium]|nr:flavodoxin family protein [Spirochaetaceae bacterium]